MLDESIVRTILERHFSEASAAQVHRAVQDIQLLELLTDERVDIAWEDSMADPDTRTFAVFSSQAPRSS